MIIDTNALSAVAEDHPDVVALLARSDQMAIPVVVLAEYRFGIAQSRHRAAYENWLAELLHDSLVLDVNEATAIRYAEIALELKRTGKPIPANDLWIAALCRQHSLPLLSRDRRFDSVAGMKRIGW
ncbi:MAG TPA: type II toxin-antitoxin system VapC family toxin [Candidatus Sulfotelmatobacter sp.]|jgi:predicted nucleic acid-binding protein